MRFGPSPNPKAATGSHIPAQDDEQPSSETLTASKMSPCRRAFLLLEMDAWPSQLRAQAVRRILPQKASVKTARGPPAQLLLPLGLTKGSLSLTVFVL